MSAAAGGANVRPDAKMVLIENVKAHPELYRTDDLRYQLVPRSQKQRLWDLVAKRCGYKKTEDAKSKWRSLLIYFRSHLEKVAKRKQRRYIPNTGNPNDKYVQLSDWQYYDAIKFMQPHMRLKFASDCISSNEVRATAAATMSAQDQNYAIAMQTDSENDCSGGSFASTSAFAASTSGSVASTSASASASASASSSSGLPMLQHNASQRTARQPQFHELADDDQSLRSFFDAMLRSAQRLPLYHRERIREHLHNTVMNEKRNS